MVGIPKSKLYFIEDKPAKECTGCNEVKILEKFSTQPTGFLGVTSRCKACIREYSNKIANPKRGKDYRRNIWYRNAYGITLEEYHRLYEKQEGKCKICNEKFNILVIDHDHNTEKVRGLLCNNCNLGIGNLMHNLKILESAIKYLRDIEDED